VVAGADAGLDEDAVKAHCRAHLAIYKVPREVRFIAQALPRTASGKVDRGTFLKQLRGQG
jgi:fatty-acyl-CoA synthase